MANTYSTTKSNFKNTYATQEKLSNFTFVSKIFYLNKEKSR